MSESERRFYFWVYLVLSVMCVVFFRLHYDRGMAARIPFLCLFVTCLFLASRFKKQPYKGQHWREKGD